MTREEEEVKRQEEVVGGETRGPLLKKRAISSQGMAYVVSVTGVTQASPRTRHLTAFPFVSIPLWARTEKNTEKIAI